MSQPRRRTAFPTAAAVAAQGLTVDQVDPDHLTFLQHVRADGNSYAVELPARGASPPVTVRYAAGMPASNGEPQSAPVPAPAPAGSDRVVEQEIPPADPLPWYETAELDEDYRNFLRQTRFENGLLVLQVGEDKIVRYTVDAVPVRLSDIPDWPDNWKPAEVAAVADMGEDGDGVGAGKEEEKVAPTDTGGPALEPRVRDSLGRWKGKRKVEQGQEEKGEGKAGAKKIKIVKGKEKKLNELPVETLNAVNIETYSSNGHDDVEIHSASGFYGVVWPTHIMERPESSFKQRLLRDLRKPFCMVEYKKLLCDATVHLPATKRRQTRRGVKYYNSTRETNQSYFDTYPDLERQVRSTSYPNQLALLRGFFFWLENVTNDEQFRPWRDDFRQYTFIPYE